LRQLEKHAVFRFNPMRILAAFLAGGLQLMSLLCNYVGGIWSLEREFGAVFSLNQHCFAKFEPAKTHSNINLTLNAYVSIEFDFDSFPKLALHFGE
jgi:hypothetical protein